MYQALEEDAHPRVQVSSFLETPGVFDIKWSGASSGRSGGGGRGGSAVTCGLGEERADAIAVVRATEI